MLAAVILLAANCISAQTDDPVVMTIGGHEVTLSEFEYSYNKNNAETVVDRKSVDEYVDMFVNYKLKVLAAIEAGIDTTSSFRQEFRMYRDQQVRPSFVTDADIEREARRIYAQTKQRVDQNGGMVRTSHILVMLPQKATPMEQDAAKTRIDSIYAAIKAGADFAQMARQCSDDKMTAKRGGDLMWVQKGQMVKEFEEKVFSLQPGEISEPFLSPYGYHIVQVRDRQMFFPYDTVRADIRRFIEQRGIRERIISLKIDSIAKASVPQVTAEQIVDERVVEMTAADPELRNLIREYHDGLLLYEISNRTVWDKAAKDEAGLSAFFKKNKKKYAWDARGFKGMAYFVKDEADVTLVKKAVKGVPFEGWADVLRKEFNDSTIRIKVIKGIFKQGDNTLVDSQVFKQNVSVTMPDGYPIPAVYGKLIKAPQSYHDVRDLVVNDYQEMLERQWIEQLRGKYEVRINREVLEKVNKH